MARRVYFQAAIEYDKHNSHDSNQILTSKYSSRVANRGRSLLFAIDCLNCSYDHPHILAGQGTCGLEIVDQVPDVDAVLVPVGGGGLIAGLALAVKSLSPDVKVYVNIHALLRLVCNIACRSSATLMSSFVRILLSYQNY